MKKTLFTGILSLSMVLAACGTDYDETVQEVEEANEQAGIGATDDTDKEAAAEKEKAEKEQAENEKVEAERVAKEQKEKDDKLAAEKAADEKAAKDKAAAEQAEKVEADKLKEESLIAEQEQIHLTIMRENMGTFVDIEFDAETKIFEMTPTNPGLIAEIEMLAAGIGLAEWGTMVDGITSMSKANSDSLGEGYGITLINPLNHENIILWIVDGTVIYNVADEL